MTVTSCEHCEAELSGELKMCEKCGVPVAALPDVPPPRQSLVPQPTASPRGAATGGIANYSIGRIPLYMIIGVCGVALLVLSFFIPYQSFFGLSFSLTDMVVTTVLSGNFSYLIILMICPGIIGIVGGIAGLFYSSWGVPVISGLISLITTAFIFVVVIYLLSVDLQMYWFALTLLGGILLVISGLMMRTVASPGTRS